MDMGRYLFAKTQVHIGMAKILLRMSILVIILSFNISQAIEISGIYSANVDVTGQDESERAIAMQIGFIEVLVKASGDSNMPNYPEVSEAIKNPSRYVSRYQYERNLGENSNLTPWILKLTFDKKSINEYLLGNGFQVWREDRPEVMVWIAVDGDDQRRILSVDDQDEIKTQLEKAAKERGVRLLYPLMDLDDIRNINFASVWGGFKDEIVNASSRYGANHIFTGKVSKQGSGSWIVKWELYGIEIDPEWGDSNMDLTVLLKSAVNRVADYMGSYYALKPGADNGQNILIQVSGIDTLTKYSKVIKYISKVPGVTSLDVLSFATDKVEVKVGIEGQSKLFFDSINAEGVIFEDTIISHSLKNGIGENSDSAKNNNSISNNTNEYYFYRML